MRTAQKRLGQNFLVDRRIAQKLAEAAHISREDTVLEIGAGSGAVTKELAERAQKVIAVEIDPNLIPKLKENLRGANNVEIVNEDILELSISSYQLINYKVVGSIPYQITSPLIHKILHSNNRPKSITFIIQKEVAEKIAAEPPQATYLANFVANFGRADVIQTIKPGAFNPPPGVDSAILQIELFLRPRIKDTVKLERFLHHGFLHPRKMLHHQFKDELLAKTKISPQARPAHLSKEDWHRLYRELTRVRERSKTRRGDGTWRN